MDDKNPVSDKALLDAAESGDVETALLLIQHGVKVNANSPLGWTPLMLACLFGYEDLAVVLLQKGANPNAETHEHDGVSSTTVLLLSLGPAKVSVINLLLQFGVDVNATNSVGTSAITLAKRRVAQGYKRPEMEQIVRLLEQAGAIE